MKVKSILEQKQGPWSLSLQESFPDLTCQKNTRASLKELWPKLGQCVPMVLPFFPEQRAKVTQVPTTYRKTLFPTRVWQAPWQYQPTLHTGEHL